MILSNLSELRNAGARTIIGTDAGIGLCHFERYADGLVVMQEAGYTLRQIIHSATSVRMQHTRGAPISVYEH